MAGNALIDATQPNQKAMKTEKTTTEIPNSTNAVLAAGWIPVAEKTKSKH